MYSIEEPKTKKPSTFTMASTSTHATETTERTTTKLNSLPDEILLYIAEFTGSYTCYLGYGVVNKRINQLFNTYSNKLTKTTSYGGYTTFQEIVEKCETELENEKYFYSLEVPEIYHQLASGVVTFNRIELLHWALEIQNQNIFQAICERAIKDRKLLITERVWNSIRDETLMARMKESTHFACIAAKLGDLESLKYFNEHGYEWNERACILAAEYGNLDCLKYLHKHGSEWDPWLCRCAARGGHLDCLKYLHEQGCPWNEGACSEAAEGGHLDCLKYLHKQGCPWDERACSSAVWGGHLDCLKYLHEQGCPWNVEACWTACDSGYCDHLDCLAYMRDNGLEWDRYGEYLDSTK